MNMGMIPVCCVQVHITALQSRSYSAFNTEVLMKVAEVVDQHGAMFARMGLAPSPSAVHAH